jgi:hypothetical protein
MTAQRYSPFPSGTVPVASSGASFQLSFVGYGDAWLNSPTGGQVAISATPLADGDPSSVFDDAHPEDLIFDPRDDLTLEIELMPPPPVVAGGNGTTTTAARSTRPLTWERRAWWSCRAGCPRATVT